MKTELEQPINQVLNLDEVELFEELYTRLAQVGKIESSGKTYSSERLEADIEEIRETKRLGHNINLILRTIPNAEGLRDKVAELLDKKVTEVSSVKQPAEEISASRPKNEDPEKIEALRRELGIRGEKN